MDGDAPQSTTADRRDSGPLDVLDHVAIEVDDIARAVDWYRTTFRCRVRYQDDTWAMIEMANVKIAFVTTGQHDPHLGFIHPHPQHYGQLRTHRDGVRYVYIKDPDGNIVELMPTK